MPAACAGLLLAALALGASGMPGSDAAHAIRMATFFSRLQSQPDNYARLRFLRAAHAGADALLHQAIDQVLATELATFGRVADAEARYPPDGPRAPDAPLPTPQAYVAVPAVDRIAAEAAGRRVVIVNEAHHRPQTRLLTLALLPRLRALGFDHFAVEGLDAADRSLAARGYPTEASGFYLDEPLYGEIVREALRLGFVVHAYEPPDAGRLPPQDRETRQAQVLQAVLDGDPHARLFVHAGYAHADKVPGQLPLGARPMAAEIIRLTGVVPLAIDQTLLGHGEPGQPGAASGRLRAAFPVRVPSVLVPRDGGPEWSLWPTHHDMTILLPTPEPGVLRPSWLSVGGRRKPVPIDAGACRRNFPCLVEARYAGEGDDAVPADQFVLFDAGDAQWPLYLAPGAYRMRFRDAAGGVLSTRALEVPGQGGLQAATLRATMAAEPTQVPTR